MGRTHCGRMSMTAAYADICIIVYIKYNKVKFF